MKRLLFGILILAIAGSGIWLLGGDKLQFQLGGAMINAGYRLQDPINRYDFQHEHATPQQVLDQFLEQNRLASGVRARWPRTTRHPVVAIVACMDGRLDTNEIVGDTRRYYYVLRLAGSVLSEKEEEMLELAVANGVEVVLFTTHTDCAAEKVAANPETRAQFPTLSKAVDEREMRFEEFLGRPRIREKIGKGELLVKWLDLDTNDEHVFPHQAKH
jgi:hypothetical protein